MANVVSPEAAREEERVLATDMFARILVPVDFSTGARRALQLAMELRRRFRGQVYVVNVAGPSDGDDFLGGLGAPYTPRELVDEADDDLHHFVDNVAPGEAPVVACDVELEGTVAEAVEEAIARYQATLVVLAKTERSRRPIFRTKSERIAAGLRCAVLFVACEPEPDLPRD
jgi:nucleotide-binding universal stress UspA family protein